MLAGCYERSEEQRDVLISWSSVLSSSLISREWEDSRYFLTPLSHCYGSAFEWQFINSEIFPFCPNKHLNWLTQYFAPPPPSPSPPPSTPCPVSHQPGREGGREGGRAGAQSMVVLGIRFVLTRLNRDITPAVSLLWTPLSPLTTTTAYRSDNTIFQLTIKTQHTHFLSQHFMLDIFNVIFWGFGLVFKYPKPNSIWS